MADQPKADKKAAESTNPPKQELGDTPVPPWEMPAPAEKAAVEPVRRALAEGVAEVDSQAKADAVIGELVAETAGETTREVAATEPPPTTPAQAAKQVAQAEQAAPPGEKASTVLAETAKVLATATDEEREVVAQAAQEVLNPEQQGAVDAADAPQRQYLRQAVLKRLKPFDALDAQLFLAINHLPHTHLLNKFFYLITFIFTGGAAWFALMGLVTLRNRRLGWRIVRESALPLALATALVEHPIKRYFRRRRPFITIIQAIVIGKKPGTWSFPSGHSATAFAGAWLLSRYWPKQGKFLYGVASLVAFSRIYLGDHYPGDVAAGSILGTLLAMFLRWLPWPWRKS